MSQNSSIEWTDTTWSPVTGCTRASAGCDNCYAVRMTHRLDLMGKEKYRGLTVLNPAGTRHFNGRVRLHERELATPLGWKKSQKVFVCSMSDLFHRDVPFEFIDRVWDVMRRTPQHTYQILTKRPERMAAYFEDVRRTAQQAHGSDLRYIPLPNVWLGTSVENQKAANERIPHLLRCPAAVRFLSVEPMLEAVDLTHITSGPDADGSGWTYRHWDALTGENWCDCADTIEPMGTGPVSWVIVGGESGPGARPMHPDWARSLRDQCQSAGVAFFFKQWGEWTPGVNVNKRSGGVRVADWLGDHWHFSEEDLARTDGHRDDEPDLYRVGKAAAGRLLDGRTWDELPEVGRA